MEVDYLIVGQGLAGTVFSEHVIQSGKSIMVVDDPSLSNSSKVAAGLYNPITGRKLVKTWNCDRLFDYLVPFYKGLERKLQNELLVEMPIYRPFPSVEELNEWMGKSAEAGYAPYVKEIKSTPSFTDNIRNDSGGILLNKSGYVRTDKLVSCYREYLESKGLFLNDKVDHTQLIIEDGGIRYKEISAKRVVFTDGRSVENNPYFDWLPLRPVKGELLYIRTNAVFDVIYNKGVFVIPLSDGICKVGATYDNKNLEEVITSEAKEELVSKLRELVKFDFEVIDQKVGTRPATKDRKPFVGLHPEHENIVIFNGLGAKGVSLAPFYAKQLLAHLEHGYELDKEVNIERFFSLF
ncbi:FAD-binding oxidoreductase [Roseivirga sp. E12]|uniref:NAD(P)/FAD-dependent oxidoreductase n=1 Tax=Roseivirga sp. E12 TaxID=2819237 RepID=UPI001ABC5761|nr:FAD-dependent oxidoreductase [Roseivirga sp. E12]MBO3700820.1 FAD-dependent oxidoreductase [Roseivirga sp. E12]